MPRKRLTTRNNQVEDLFAKSTYKSPKKVFIESPLVAKYKADRDSLIEFGMLGMKSALAAKILTVAEDKSIRSSRHAEISLQAKYCAWVKGNYPNIKFLRHEREGKRSYVAQNLNKKLNNAGSMPDMEFLEPVGKYLGLLIEFKRPGEDWLLKDGITVKPKYADQYANHCMLWDKGYVVYFCNDMEIAKQIWMQYYSGRNMRQRIYKVK